MASASVLEHFFMWHQGTHVLLFLFHLPVSVNFHRRVCANCEECHCLDVSVSFLFRTLVDVQLLLFIYTLQKALREVDILNRDCSPTGAPSLLPVFNVSFFLLFRRKRYCAKNVSSLMACCWTLTHHRPSCHWSHLPLCPGLLCWTFTSLSSQSPLSPFLSSPCWYVYSLVLLL